MNQLSDRSKESIVKDLNDQGIPQGEQQNILLTLNSMIEAARKPCELRPSNQGDASGFAFHEHRC